MGRTAKTSRLSKLIPMIRLGIVLMVPAILFAAIGPMAQARESGGSSNVRLSGFQLSQTVDGTSPFDADDADGNDSSSSNGRVRSFDEITYTMSYTTEIIDEVTVVDEADIDVEIELPMSPKEAVFNMDTMNWLVDPIVTYYRADGTSSSDWTAENATEFVRQTVTGTRHIVNGTGGNAIPGTGTLVFGVSVKAAPNGTKVKPSMSIWMHGRSTEKLTAEFGDVVVSAKPSLDVDVYGISPNVPRYFNTSTYMQSTTGGDGFRSGKMYRITTHLMMRNDAQHGMRGYELPIGDITFDLNLSVTNGDDDITDVVTPFFWDYNANEQYWSHGYLGHQLGYAISGAGFYNSQIYEPGVPSVISDGNTIHYTFKDYAFDYKTYEHPSSTPYPLNTTYTFCATSLFIFIPDDSLPSGIDDVIFNVEATNLRYDSETRADVTGEWTLDNNVKTAGIEAHQGPSDDYEIRDDGYPAQNGEDTNLAKQVNLNTTPAQDGIDKRGQAGDRIQLSYWFIAYGSCIITDCDFLLKIDTNNIDISESTWGISTSYDGRDPCEKLTKDNVTCLYAAKPDGTGWSSNEEMDRMHEENLVYFKSYEECEAAGYVCVGVLMEVRNAFVQAPFPGIMPSIDNVFIRDDAKVGDIAQTTSEWRIFDECDDVPSWLDYKHGTVDGAYGVGNASLDGGDVSLKGTSGYSGMFADGYSAPTRVYYTTFVPSQYDSFGNITGYAIGKENATGRIVSWEAAGSGIYIVNGTASATIDVSDEANGAPKSVFDLDQGERTAWYTVHPSLEAYNPGTDAKTNAQVIVNLPEGVHYVDGTLSMSPAQTEYVDGTSDVASFTFEFTDVPIDGDLPAITFAVTIGEPGTNDDVAHAQSFTANVKINAGLCKKYVSSEEKNDYATFSVIRLSSSAVMKSVRDIVMPKLSTNEFTLRFGNSSNEQMDDVSLYDVMPYDGDLNGSNFSGGYRITGIDIDLTHAPTLLARIGSDVPMSYTADTSARISVTSDVEGKLDDDGIAWNDISGWSAAEGHLVASGLDISDMTALRFDVGDMPANEYFDVVLSFDFADTEGNAIPDADNGTQQPNDLYANSFYEWSPNQPATVRSNVVQTTVEYIDIKLTKTATPETITEPVAGDTEIQYDFVIENTGRHALHDVSLTDDMLDGVTDVAIDWNGSTDPSTGEGTLSAGEKVTATATYVITQDDIDTGSVTNEATATGENESGTDTVESTDDAITTITGSASVDIVKDVDKSSIDLGNDDGTSEYRRLTYKFTVTNTGNLTLHDVKVDDEMLGGNVKLDWSTSTDASTGDGILLPGEAVTGTATYDIKQSDIDAGSVMNTATVTGTDPSDKDVTDTDDAVTDLSGSAEIELVKDVDKPTIDMDADDGSTAYRTLTYTFTITNTGSLTLTNVHLTDVMLDDKMTIDWDGSSDVSTPAGTLSPCETVKATGTYVLSQSDIDAGIVTNTATATGTPTEGDDVSSTDDAVTDITASPSIELVKSIDNEKPAIGTSVKWLFNVTNTGSTTLTNVTVSDPMVDSVDYGHWDRVLEPQETATVSADYIVNAADVSPDGTNINTATVTGSSNGTTTSEVTDDDMAQVEVETHPHLSLTKTVDKTELRDDAAYVGALLAYSFTIKNDGDVDLTNVSIDDYLDGVSDVTIDWASSTDAATDDGELSVGETVTATATYAITQSDIDAGKIVNTAVSNGATQSGQDVQSNEATAETVIIVSEPEPTPEEPDDGTGEDNPPVEEPDDGGDETPTDHPDDTDDGTHDNVNKPTDDEPNGSSVNDANDANDAGETDNADIDDSENMDDPSDNQTGEPIVSTGVSMAATVIALVASAIISAIIIARKISK